MCWNNGWAANSRRGVRFTSASLGSTEPCVLPSLQKLHRNVAVLKKKQKNPLTIHRPHFKLIHPLVCAPACTHAHTQALCACPSVLPRSNFSPEVSKHQLSINPPQTCTFFCFSFHPWHAGRKTAGLVYTSTCISIT